MAASDTTPNENDKGNSLLQHGEEHEKIVDLPSHTSNTERQTKERTFRKKSGVLVSNPGHLKPYSRKKICFDLVMAFLSFVAQLGWDALMQHELHDQFFKARPEFLYMMSLSRLTKMVLIHSPFLAKDAREMLRLDMRGHKATMELYDPEKHDTDYRGLKTNLLTQTECARLRSLIMRMPSHNEGWQQQVVAGAVELSEANLYPLLGFGSDEDTPALPEEEKNLLRDVLRRIQTAAEEHFDSPSIFLDYSGLTVRRSPIPEDWSDSFRRLHFRSAGGLSLHADQCHLDMDADAYATGFECHITSNHCCPQRTHSAVLYLNDPNDNDLVGGELYVVNRQDLIDDTTPSYSGIALSKQLQHTVRVPPTCGNLMLFASDARNMHGILPIRKGTRFTLPTWLTSPPDIPWHKPEVVRQSMDPGFWDWFRMRCDNMGTELPVPSGLKQYQDNCDGMVDAVKELASLYRLEE